MSIKKIFRKKRRVEEKKERLIGYEKAKADFFDTYMQQAKALNSWKLAFFIAMFLLGITLSTTLYLTTRTELKPYIVKVLMDTNSGKILEISTASVEKYNLSELEKEKNLKELITRMRTVPRDEVLIGRNYSKNYNFWMGKASKEKYKEMFLKENMTDFIKSGFARDIQFISYNKFAGTEGSYQVRWQENTYDKEGMKVLTENMLGIFSLKIEAPKTIQERDNNIYGIKVNDFSISKEN